MNLISLPADVRVHMWRLLLTRPCPVDILFEKERQRDVLQDVCCSSSPDDNGTGCEYLKYSQGRFDPETRLDGDSRWTCIGPKFSIEVFLTCRSIYKEASDVLYKENKFIIDTLTSNDVPVFDFLRVRSLHILARGSERKINLQKYKEVIQRIHLDPGVRLEIRASLKGRRDSFNCVEALQSLGPVKSCSVSLTWNTKDDCLALARKLMNIEKVPATEFALYDKLPVELRCHILSFTNLVQDYYLCRGNITFRVNCCRSCCETLFGCFCVRSPRHNPSSTYSFWEATSCNISQTCRCIQDPLPLLQVSSGFRRDALRVLFSRSSFEFIGHTFYGLVFLRRIEGHLKLMRRIVLNLDYDDFEDDEDGGFQWDTFIDCIKAHLSLPLLSLKIRASYDIVGHGPLSTSKIEHMRTFYQSLIPGLQRLTAKGLRRFSIHFSQKELKGWEGVYELKVLGLEDVRSA